MQIRKFKNSDAVDIHQIIRDCFLYINVGKHTKTGVDLQIENNSPECLIKRSKKINYFVAKIKGKLVGVCGFDDKKVHTLFIDLKYQRQGIGKKLMSKVLKEAKNKGIRKLTTWSTIYASPFYEKYGFRALKEIKLPEGKEEVVLIEMEKSLN